MKMSVEPAFRSQFRKGRSRIGLDSGFFFLQLYPSLVWRAETALILTAPSIIITALFTNNIPHISSNSRMASDDAPLQDSVSCNTEQNEAEQEAPQSLLHICRFCLSRDEEDLIPLENVLLLTLTIEDILLFTGIQVRSGAHCQPNGLAFSNPLLV